eukprot:gene8744-11816_t
MRVNEYLVLLLLLACYPSNSFIIRPKCFKSITDLKCITNASADKIHNDSLAKDAATTSVLNSAALVAGTTIGGGFLAIPHVTAPLGFIPSTIALTYSWLFLLLSSFAFVDCINALSLQNRDESKTNSISIYSVSRSAFGSASSFLTGIMFLLLTTSTLVAQFTKVVPLLKHAFMFTCQQQKLYIISAASVILFIISFQLKQSVTDRINTILTSIMLLSFGTLVSFSKQAGWELARVTQGADYGLLLPVGLSAHLWAIPTIMQLLVYSEIVPIVYVRMNKDVKKVKLALTIGSFIPLLMCTIWTVVALGIIPVAQRAVNDPLAMLMSSKSTALSTAVLTLGLSAIITTMIGTVLATKNFYEDLFQLNKPSVITQDKVQLFQSAANWFLFHAPKLLSIIPSAAIAAVGSDTLYYIATNFAGAFPVTFLWGLLPSLSYFQLKIFNKIQDEKAKIGSLTCNITLIALSLLMLYCNTLKYLSNIRFI